jgi:AraC-like DNA-binding protein
MQLSFWNLISLAAVVPGLLLAFFLWGNRKGRRAANRFLAALVFVYALDIGLETLYALPQIVAYTWLIGVNDLLFFLYGPLLYLYAVALTAPHHRWVKWCWLHFLPCLLLAVFYTFALFGKSAAVKLQSEGIESFQPVSASGFAVTEAWRSAIEFASGIHELIYIGLTLWLLRAHTRRIKDTFSRIDEINLNWLRWLTALTGFIVAVDLALFFFIQTNVVAFDKAVSVMLLLCAAVIYAIGYMGLRQPEIFSPPVAEYINVPEPIPAEPESSREKYYKSSLTAEQAAAGIAQLQEVMKSQKLYLQGNLKLAEVAEALNLSTNNLSQIINEQLGQNFYDFVNGYRVEAAQALLLDPAKDNLTLLAIAFEAGFNSKSTFNSVFKKHCQVTPSEYKKKRRAG